MERTQNIYFPKGNSWKAVLLSILTASIFWLFQSLNKNYSTNLTYPITFDFPREQYVIVEELPDEVQINVSGVGWNIFKKTFFFGVNPIRIELETPALAAKIVGAALLANVNDQLPKLQVNYVISDTLYLHIEPKISRTFSVFVDSLSIDLKDDFRVVSPVSVRPDSVTISGPPSVINPLPPNLPLQINQKNIDDSFEEMISVEVKEQQSLLDIVPEEIIVQFDVEEFVTVSYKLQLTRLQDLTLGIYALDSTVHVTYSIARFNQDAIDKHQILVVALLETLNKEDSTVQLSIQSYPELISSISLDSTSLFLKVIYE